MQGWDNQPEIDLRRNLISKSNLLGIMSAFLLTLSVSSNAAIVVLDFEGVSAAYPNSSETSVRDFYNGGTSGDGTSGTDYGIAFLTNAFAICLNTPGTFCSNTSRGGLGDPDSQLGGLHFLYSNGSESFISFMNVAGGFDTGFSFFYTAITHTGSVSVYDGLNGTGNLLATLDLALTPSNCPPEFSAGFCTFVAAGIGFSGTAQSVSFSGTAGQIVFDDVTLGSVIPGPVIPVPPAVWLFGSGLLGLIGISRRKKTA